MEKKTREYIQEMGQTGQGIVKESDIDMTQDNEFTNKWGEPRTSCLLLLTYLSLAIIRKACPWFFDMRDLIGERPNLIPPGTGNSRTVIDFDVNDSNSQHVSSHAAESDGDGLASMSDGDDLGE